MSTPAFEDGRVTRFLHFTASDYRNAAQACRVAAVQAEGDAQRQSNPGIVANFNETATRYRELAQKLELAARVL